MKEKNLNNTQQIIIFLLCSVWFVADLRISEHRKIAQKRQIKEKYFKGLKLHST
jgi:hypothetical protein